MATILAICFALLVSAIGPRSPWLGLLLMFDSMGLAQVAQPLCRFRMPVVLRPVEPGRFTEGLYRWLGVRGFGRLLRQTPLRHLNGSVCLGGGTLAELSARLESAEAIHFWAAVLFTPYVVYVGSRGLVAETISFSLVLVVFNVYPIVHLRLVRARLGRVDLAIGARRRGSLRRNGGT